MRFPWISREAHEAICAAKDAQIADLITRCDFADANAGRLTEKVEALSDKYVALATKPLPQTITQVEPSHALPEAPKRELSVVDAVIRMESRNDRRLAAYFRSRAKQLREDHPHWTDQQVATELSRWETAEAMAPEFLVGATAVTPNEQAG